MSLHWYLTPPSGPKAHSGWNCHLNLEDNLRLKNQQQFPLMADDLSVSMLQTVRKDTIRVESKLHLNSFLTFHIRTLTSNATRPFDICVTLFRRQITATRSKKALSSYSTTWAHSFIVYMHILNKDINKWNPQIFVDTVQSNFKLKAKAYLLIYKYDGCLWFIST